MSFFKNRDQEMLEELKKFDKRLEIFEQRVHDDLKMHVKPIASLLSDLRMTFDIVNENVNDLNKQFQNIAINHLADRIQNTAIHQEKTKGLKPVSAAIKLGNNRYTKAQKAKIFSMLDAGQKPTPIAKKLNIPVSYVYYMQKENRKKKDTDGTGKAS